MKNETALITGASSGIGLELAKILASQHTNLVLVARSEDKLLQVAQKIRQEHEIDVMILTKDLNQPEAPREIYNQLKKEGLTVDILINNAGFGWHGHFAFSSLERMEEMIQVNITSLIRLTRLFLPDMIKNKRGSIMNVASTASFSPGPLMSVYYATKAFVLSFSEGLREEVLDKNIMVTCLCPGYTATNFGEVSGVNKRLLSKFGAAHAEKVAKKGVQGLRRGKAIVVPGLINKLGAVLVGFIPRILVRKIIKILQS